MHSFRFWAICGTLLSVVFASQATAHEGEPLRSISVRAGQFPMVVNYYNAPRGGEALIFTIHPAEPLREPLNYKVVAVPGASVNAVPVNATVTPDPDRPDGVGGTVYLPVSGQWLLSLNISGPSINIRQDVPILASPPPVIPVWLGWVVGLLPVWTILGYIGWRNWRSRTWHGRSQPAT
jgi:hypothetical protein